MIELGGLVELVEMIGLVKMIELGGLVRMIGLIELAPGDSPTLWKTESAGPTRSIRR